MTTMIIVDMAGNALPTKYALCSEKDGFEIYGPGIH